MALCLQHSAMIIRLRSVFAGEKEMPCDIHVQSGSPLESEFTRCLRGSLYAGAVDDRLIASAIILGCPADTTSR
jgi:hypothetical protein